MILPTSRAIALIGAAPLLALLLTAIAPGLWVLSLVYLGVALAALLLDAAMAIPASRIEHRVLLPEVAYVGEASAIALDLRSVGRGMP